MRRPLQTDCKMWLMMGTDNFFNYRVFLFWDLEFHGIIWDLLTTVTPNSNNEPDKFSEVCSSLNFSEVL